MNACAPPGAENHAAIAAIMGAAAPTGERKVAFVRCNGGVNAVKRYEYIGVKDCISATKVAAGPLECQFGCLGFGSCVAACQFGRHVHRPQRRRRGGSGQVHRLHGPAPRPAPAI